MLKRYLPQIAIAIGLVGLLAVSIAYLVTGAGQAPTVAPATALPHTLSGLDLTDAAYGADAVSEVARMHGKPFTIESGARGTYGASQAATLWVAQAADAATAASMVTAMHDRIAAGNSPFTPAGEQTIAQRSIHVLEGMGQQHYYFQSGALVVWLAADPTIAQQALREAMAFYP